TSGKPFGGEIGHVIRANLGRPNSQIYGAVPLRANSNAPRTGSTTVSLMLALGYSERKLLKKCSRTRAAFWKTPPDMATGISDAVRNRRRVTAMALPANSDPAWARTSLAAGSPALAAASTAGSKAAKLGGGVAFAVSISLSILSSFHVFKIVSSSGDFPSSSRLRIADATAARPIQ